MGTLRLFPLLALLPLIFAQEFPNLVEDVEVISERNCKSTYSLSSFHLATNNEQNPNLDCTYQILKTVPSVCQINLSFNDFEVNCELGGISIDGQATICGSLSGKNRTLPFKRDELELSMLLKEVSKYNVTIRQLDCPEDAAGSGPFYTEFEDFAQYQARLGQQQLLRLDNSFGCNRIVQNSKFVLQSPNFPRPYPNQVECVTIVSPSNPNTCGLELRFDEFQVEASDVVDECANDYLEVSDGENDQNSMKYCGFVSGIRLVKFNTNFIRIAFRSNEQFNDRGYSIVANEVPCEDGRDPGFRTSTVPPTDLDTYGKRPLPQLEVDVAVPDDAVNVIDARDHEEVPTLLVEPIFPCFNHTEQKLTQKEEFPAELEEFPAEDVVPGIIDLRQPIEPSLDAEDTGLQVACSAQFSLSSPVEIQSPQYPDPYPNGVNCEYIIAFPPNTCNLQVEYKSFTVDCQGDYLRVGDKAVCGNERGTTLYPVQEGQESIRVNFVSNEQGVEAGFDVVISRLPCGNPNPEDVGISDLVVSDEDLPRTETGFKPIFDSYESPNEEGVLPIYGDFKGQSSASPNNGLVLEQAVSPDYSRPAIYPVISPNGFVPQVPSFAPVDTYGPPAQLPFSPESAPIYNPRPSFYPSRPSFQPTESYGAPVGPVITARPPLNPSRPQFNPTDSYGAPVGPVVTARPPLNPPRPQFNPTDNYGAPVGPVVTARPPLNPNGQPSYNPRPQFNPTRPPFVPTARPPYNPPPSDGYGAPIAPAITARPPAPPPRPSYKPKRPSYRPPKIDLFGPIVRLVRAKKTALANGLRSIKRTKAAFFRSLKRGRGQKPSSTNPKPSYGPPRPKPNYGPPKPSYAAPSRRPTSIANPTYKRNARQVGQRCGLETLENGIQVVTSPNYPDNYPNDSNCTEQIHPNLNACYLKLTMADFIVEESLFCYQDHVQIRAGNVEQGRLCGQQTDQDLIVENEDGQPWEIRFSSDSAGTTRGFKMFAEQIPCSGKRRF